MEAKGEGPAFPPVPLIRGLVSDAAHDGARVFKAEPWCEMCGSPVIAAQCKRICLRCGFMTGCTEGI